MRTSHLQYRVMVQFMEANGDLSKATGGARSRLFMQMKWIELTTKLNSDGTGDPRSEDKWRKVWSDYKNNCKKKCAKIKRAASSGGRPLQLSMTDLENRVMQIIAKQAAAGMVVNEAGLQRDEVSNTPEAQPDESLSEELSETYEIDWIIPGLSSQPTTDPLPPTEDPPSPPVSPEDEECSPPPKKFKKDLRRLFIEADSKAREYARERDRAYDALEKERLRLRNEELRLREFELRERVRQRDVELQLQTKWLEFMKGAMGVFVRYLDKKS